MFIRPRVSGGAVVLARSQMLMTMMVMTVTHLVIMLAGNCILAALGISITV